jgi:hypothetical protein
MILSMWPEAEPLFVMFASKAPAELRLFLNVTLVHCVSLPKLRKGSVS